MSDSPIGGFGCAKGDGIVICSPRWMRFRTVRRCRKCKARRRGFIYCWLWYDPEFKCSTCNGTLAEWRTETTTRAEVQAWVMRELEAYTA
jgi:hypothetical protein